MAEEHELCANPARPAAGTVLEAYLDRRTGPTATLLVQAGTLRVGDAVLAGAAHGRVRTLRDDRRRGMREAGPSVVAQVCVGKGGGG